MAETMKEYYQQRKQVINRTLEKMPETFILTEFLGEAHKVEKELGLIVVTPTSKDIFGSSVGADPFVGFWKVKRSLQTLVKQGRLRSTEKFQFKKK